MTLRIATWNIRKGGVRRRAEIGAVLRAIDPDVVVLQEATRPSVVAWVAGQMAARSVTCAPGRSVALISRLPLGAIRWHPLPTGRSFLEAELPQANLRILGVHLRAGLSGRGERRRALEMEALLEVAAAPPGRERTIIAGDLNAIAPSDSPAISALPLWIRLLLRADGGIGTAVVERALGAGFVDAFRRFHPTDPGSTLPVDRPTVRLDYFLLGTGLAEAAVRCDLGDIDRGLLVAASDHLPLVLLLDPGAPSHQPPDRHGAATPRA